MTNIGARIYKARQASGMTAENLARRLGISVQKVSEWENGGTEPSAQNIFSLYDIFGQKLFSDVAISRRTSLTAPVWRA